MEHYFTNNESLKSDFRSVKYVYKDTPFVFTSDLGVFSKNKIDYGSKSLLEKVLEIESTGKKILDVGCGYGFIGIVLSKILDSTVDMVDRMLSTLGSVIVVLIVSAGMLAFVVLYNLNNINITERQRELATLKVLGFFDMEVSQYVLRENILLTIAGILAGSGVGILLHRYIIMTIEVDAVMFGRNIRPVSFLYCAALTCIFSVIVNISMHNKLKKIDMVESLKSVE